MALTPEQIKELLAKPERKRKTKKGIDTSQRTYMTWFKLATKMLDEETGEPAQCSNPNCQDTRRTKMVARVNGVDMCRRCFLADYQLETEGQEVLDVS